MTKLDSLKDFLDRYAAAYREKYDIDEATYITIPFLCNNGYVYIKVLGTEPDTAVGEYWFDGTDLRLTANVGVDTENGFLHTYDLINKYSDSFLTGIYFIGESLVLPDSEHPGITYIGSKGRLKVFSGLEYVDLPLGDNGSILVADSAASLGVRWVDPTTIVDQDPDLTWNGTWVAGKLYTIGDIIKSGEQTYVCITDHVSSTALPTAEWENFIGPSTDGADGSPGAQGEKGSPGLSWKGTYSDQETYATDDVVSYYRSSYRSTVDSNISLPTTSDWEPVAVGQDPFVLTHEFVAQEELTTYRVVVTNEIGSLEYANHHNQDHAYRVVGVTLGSGSSGTAVVIAIHGYVKNSNWNFVAGTQVYVGSGGNITSTVPTDGFICVLGKALSSTEVLVNLSNSVLL